MLTLEATAVTEQGRITPACLGLWDARCELALGQTLQRARQLAPEMPVCIQLAHAGRKASSATPWNGGQLLSTDHPSSTPNSVFPTFCPRHINRIKHLALPF